MSLTDIFNADAFGLISLTQSIEELPFRPGRIGQLGIFTVKGIPHTTFAVEMREGIITILPTAPRGSPASLGKGAKRTMRSFACAHIPHDDTVLADEVQNVRAFGSENTAQGVAQVVNDRLTLMKANHETTFEHLRAGAIKGVVYDSDGSTVLSNLFTEFGVSEVDTDFVLGTAGTDIRAKCLVVARSIEDTLGGSGYSKIRVLCHHEWFDRFISHATVVAAYARYKDGEMARSDPRSGFSFAGMIFEEYRGKVGTVDFIPKNTARAFPEGVPGLFQMVFAPADFIETANTLGKPIYAKQEILPMNRGVHIHTQSNPFAMCTRPAVCCKLSTSN